MKGTPLCSGFYFLGDTVRTQGTPCGVVVKYGL